MPKVKTVVGHSNEIGVRDGLAENLKKVGDVYEVSDGEAEALIRAGWVEPYGKNAGTSGAK